MTRSFFLYSTYAFNNLSVIVALLDHIGDVLCRVLLLPSAIFYVDLGWKLSPWRLIICEEVEIDSIIQKKFWRTPTKLYDWSKSAHVAEPKKKLKVTAKIIIERKNGPTVYNNLYGYLLSNVVVHCNYSQVTILVLVKQKIRNCKQVKKNTQERDKHIETTSWNDITHSKLSWLPA